MTVIRAAEAPSPLDATSLAQVLDATSLARVIGGGAKSPTLPTPVILDIKGESLEVKHPDIVFV